MKRTPKPSTKSKRPTAAEKRAAADAKAQEEALLAYWTDDTPLPPGVEPRFFDLMPPEEELRWINEQIAAQGKTTVTKAEFDALAAIAARIPRAGPRPVPKSSKPTQPMSLRQAAWSLNVDGKSTRFKARFIDSGRLAADRVGNLWQFDAAEFKREKDEVREHSNDGRRRTNPHT